MTTSIFSRPYQRDRPGYSSLASLRILSKVIFGLESLQGIPPASDRGEARFNLKPYFSTNKFLKVNDFKGNMGGYAAGMGIDNELQSAG
jgi:hypothetical protein